MKLEHGKHEYPARSVRSCITPATSLDGLAFSLVSSAPRYKSVAQRVHATHTCVRVHVHIDRTCTNMPSESPNERVRAKARLL